jgi:hypothetical protein
MFMKQVFKQRYQLLGTMEKETQIHRVTHLHRAFLCLRDVSGL